MNAIRIHTHVDSDTLHLPQIKAMIGKDVEIIVIEETGKKNGAKRNLDAFFALAGKIKIDEKAISELRNRSKL
jgi:hypothetical protein